MAILECHPYDPNTVYTVLNRKAYKSVNKGGAWKDISGSLPAINFSSITFDKSSNEGLYVGSDAGTYYRDADMTDWVMYGESFPVSVGVSELEIYHDQRNRAESRLRASTFGRGVWEIKLAETNTALPPAFLTTTVADKDVDLACVPPFYEQIESNPGKLTEMIDLSTQPKGVYLLTIRSEKGQWKQKITIQ
jgi:hypothetical protein